MKGLQLLTAGLIAWNSLGGLALAEVQRFEARIVPTEDTQIWNDDFPLLEAMALEKVLQQAEKKLNYPFMHEARKLLTDAEFYGLLLRSGTFEYDKGKYRGQMDAHFRIDPDVLRKNYWHRMRNNLVYRLYARLYSQYNEALALAKDFQNSPGRGEKSRRRLTQKLKKAQLLSQALRAHDYSDWSGVIRLSSQYLNMDDSSYIIYDLRARAHYHKKDYASAIQDSRNALALFHDDAHSYANLAMIATEQGKPKAAIKYYYEALFRDGLNPYYYNNRGAIFQNTGDKHRAFIDYDKAVSLEQREPTFYMNRGEMFYQKQDMINAENDFTSAILLDHSNGEYRYRRGNVYLSIENYDKAIADYTKAVKLGEHYPELSFNRGLAYEAKKWFTKAFKDYEHALLFEPKNAKYLEKRAELSTKLVDYKGILGDATRLVNVDPKNPKYRLMRGKALLHKGRYSAALRDFHVAIRYDKENGEAFFYRGQTYRQVRACEAANEDFKQACNLDFSEACKHGCSDDVTPIIPGGAKKKTNQKANQTSNAVNFQTETFSETTVDTGPSGSSSEVASARALVSKLQNTTNITQVANLITKESSGPMAAVFGFTLTFMISMTEGMGDNKAKSQIAPFKSRIEAVMKKIEANKNIMTDPNFDGRPLLKEVLNIFQDLEQAKVFKSTGNKKPNPIVNNNATYKKVSNNRVEINTVNASGKPVKMYAVKENDGVWRLSIK